MTTPALFDLPDTRPARPERPANQRFVAEFVVYGLPGPQGSKRARPVYTGSKAKGTRRFTGRVALVESSAKVKPWRASVTDLAKKVGKGLAMLRQPLVVDMVFTLPRPKGHYRTGRNAHLLRANAPAWPDVKPDLSKLVRAAEDAITDAKVWRDDALVVEFGRVAKVYPGGDCDALDSPGVRVRIYALGPEPAATPMEPVT